MRLSLLTVVGVLLCAVPAWAQPFDNKAVMALRKAGLGDDTILAKIASLPCHYDTSTDALIALKRGGLSDAVIASMVRRCTGADKAQGPGEGPPPSATRRAGIYMALGDGTPPPMQGLHATLSSAVKVVGNGSILFPRMVKVVVPLGHAQAVSQSGRPVFWFYFNKTDKRVNEFGGTVAAAAQSPTEFSLVHLKINGDVRQFVVGRVQPYVGVTGIDPKYALPFDVAEVGEGVFRVEMVHPMEPGEYAFVLPGSGGRNASYQMYEFEVRAPDQARPAGTR